MPDASTRILIVGGAETTGTAARLLKDGNAGFFAKESTTAEQASTAVETFEPNCVLIDLESSAANEEPFLQSIRDGFVTCQFAIVAITGGTHDTPGHAFKAWTHDSVPKAELTATLLSHAIQGALEKVALQRRIAELEDENAQNKSQLQLAQEAGCLGTWIWDPARKGLTCSPHCLKLFGRENEPAQWDNIFDEWLHPDDRERVADELEAALSGALFDSEYRTVWPDETIHWLRSHGRMLADVSFATRFHGATVDITSTRHGSEQLQRATKDLEQFAYVASHDLQEPLRNVMSFSELFSRRNKDVDGESRQYLEYVKQGGTRMQALVTDLLTFSRATQVNLEELETVDCNEVLREVLADMQVQVHESGAQIEARELPCIQASFSQIAQLLQNLLSNAIKFRGAGNLLITVSAKRTRNGWEFCVTDTGIGFEMDYCDRIFEAFRRLHGRDQYPGTGLGLAICKRIVERHGGRIWAESGPGKGSKFFFTVSDTAAAASA